jgi:hypothetical protein
MKKNIFIGIALFCVGVAAGAVSYYLYGEHKRKKAQKEADESSWLDDDYLDGVDDFIDPFPDGDMEPPWMSDPADMSKDDGSAPEGVLKDGEVARTGFSVDAEEDEFESPSSTEEINFSDEKVENTSENSNEDATKKEE